MYEVVRVSSISRSQLVYFPELVNKPTTQNTREANEFVHAKRLAGKKPLLAGYLEVLFNVFSSLAKTNEEKSY